jgi:hypothetical protein
MQVPEIHLHRTSLPILHLLHLAAQPGTKVTIKDFTFSVIIFLSVYEGCYGGCRTTYIHMYVDIYLENYGI